LVLLGGPVGLDDSPLAGRAMGAGAGVGFGRGRTNEDEDGSFMRCRPEQR
jgi:hypothetical protein